jgi:hypothetical protein
VSHKSDQGTAGWPVFASVGLRQKSRRAAVLIRFPEPSANATDLDGSNPVVVADFSWSKKILTSFKCW